MREIITSVEIEVSAQAVWKVLTNFSDYPSWNPFIKSISGTPRIGEQLTITLQLPTYKDMTFTPVVQECAENQELRWLGKVLTRGIFAGEHRFGIVVLGPHKSKFIHSETFKGVLVPFMEKMLVKTREGFEAMNEALKKKCEQA